MWQAIKNFFARLFGKNPVSAPAPVVSAPASSAPVPAPAPAPTPAPSPVPDETSALPLPEGVIAIDDRGFAKFAAVEAERASNPNWANAVEWYAIEGLGKYETFTTRANLTEAWFLLAMGSSGAITDGALCVNTAYAMTPDPENVKAYIRGLPYEDARSFIQDNKDSTGNVVYRGPRPSDIPAWVAACNAKGQIPIKRAVK